VSGSEFTGEDLLRVLDALGVNFVWTRRRPRAASIHWGPILGLDPKRNKIYEVDPECSSMMSTELVRCIVLHESAHLLFWSDLGVCCPESLLIAWENRVISTVAGEAAADRHLHSDYTRSTTINEWHTIENKGIKDPKATTWWQQAEVELDAMGMSADFHSLCRRPTSESLKRAMISTARAQEFKLPDGYIEG
jgi:hypothetical protein